MEGKRCRWIISSLLSLLLSLIEIHCKKYTVESCNVTAVSTENYIIVNLAYNNPLGYIRRNKIILNTPLNTYTDFGNICTNFQVPDYGNLDCDNSQPYEVIISHDVAHSLENTFILHGFNFSPEGELFPTGSVEVNAADYGNYGTKDRKCDSFSSSSYTPGTHSLIYQSSMSVLYIYM